MHHSIYYEYVVPSISENNSENEHVMRTIVKTFYFPFEQSLLTILELVHGL
jgi:hypothetical protein